MPHIGCLICGNIEEVIRASDFLVVGTSGAQIFDALERHVREDQVVLDLVHMPDRGRLRGRVAGLSW